MSLVLIAPLLLAGPATAHALASAAYRMGIPLSGPVYKDLTPLVKQTPPWKYLMRRKRCALDN